jgi:hypothetical protein
MRRGLVTEFYGAGSRAAESRERARAGGRMSPFECSLEVGEGGCSRVEEPGGGLLKSAGLGGLLWPGGGVLLLLWPVGGLPSESGT